MLPERKFGAKAMNHTPEQDGKVVSCWGFEREHFRAEPEPKDGMRLRALSHCVLGALTPKPPVRHQNL